MSADELELTFIRCTNCKSLMPSAAEKCGMCGFQRSEESTLKSRQRLRQQSDLNISEVSQAPQPAVNPPEESKEEKDNFRFKFAKPANETKREYLNLSPQKPQEKPAPVESWQKNDAEEEYQDDELDDYDDNLDDSSDREDNTDNARVALNENSADRPKKRRRRKKKKPRQTDQTAEFSQNEKYVSQETSQGPRTPLNFDEKPYQSKFNSEPQGPTFAQPMNKRAEEQRERKGSDMNDRNENDIFRTDTNRQEKPRYENTRNEPRNPELRSDSPNQEPQRFDPPRQEQHKQEVPRAENKLHDRGSAQKENIDGKLLGWLVNYSMNGKGVSFELRAGRRFVGRQSLRQDDLIIPDSALSTPHCLLQVEDGQIFIQDLMSENGTYIKTSNSNEFQKKDASVKLNHGDIVKFGSYELIVCLVPRN